MRKSLLILLLVVLLSVALVSCDPDKEGNGVYRKDGVTDSYVMSRAQFKVVTGILLPELPDLELSDYYKSYTLGQTDYNFDIVGGSALTPDIYDTFVKFFKDDKEQVGEVVSSGDYGEFGKYTSWKFNGRGMYCALDYEPLKLRIDTFPIPDGLESDSDWKNFIWP